MMVGVFNIERRDDVFHCTIIRCLDTVGDLFLLGQHLDERYASGRLRIDQAIEMNEQLVRLVARHVKVEK